jgi:hypothetical protein
VDAILDGVDGAIEVATGESAGASTGEAGGVIAGGTAPAQAASAMITKMNKLQCFMISFSSS